MLAFFKKYRVLLITLLALLPTLLPIICGERGYAAPESCCFLMHYNSNLPLSKLIFDPAKTDWGFYQGRELSYLLDALDARFIGWCIKNRMSHFFSVSSMLFLLGTILLQQLMAAKVFPRLKWYIAALPSLMYGAAYVSRNTPFFRCSKPAVAFFATLLFFSVAMLMSRQKQFRLQRWENWAIFFSLVLMPLFDRQGFFVTGIFCCGAIACWIAGCMPQVAEKFSLDDNYRAKAGFCSFCGFAGLLVSSLWNLWICPEIIHAVNGYYPSFEYQQLPPGALWNIGGGLPFVFENIGFLFISKVFAYINVFGLAVAGFLLFFAIKAYKGSRAPLILPLSFGASLLAMVLIGNMMTARHIMILNEDVLFGGYFLVCLAVFSCFMVVLLAVSGKAAGRIIVCMLLSAIVSGIIIRSNLIAEPGASTDHIYIYKLYRHRLVEFLNDPDTPKVMPMPFSNSVLIDYFRGVPGL